MNAKTKLFIVLWSAGFAGVLSFLLVDLEGLLAILPNPSGAERPAITPALKILSLLQPAVILAVAVLVGLALAPKVGLSSPIAESISEGREILPAVRSQIVAGMLGGVAGGFSIILAAQAWQPFLPVGAASTISGFGKFLPLATRVLYGGITEELLLRWGLMTLIVWAALRIFRKAHDRPGPFAFVGAILISSFVFGLGHLPVAYMLFPEPAVALTLFVIVGNSLFGSIAGFLFWKFGLESAMIAHMTAHVVMFAASYFGAYF